MSNRLFRPPVPLLAIYAIVCLLWIGFADGIAPNIISAAYNELSLSVLNWFFKSHRSLPLEHYLDRWSVFAAAVSIAIALHLAMHSSSGASIVDVSYPIRRVPPLYMSRRISRIAIGTFMQQVDAETHTTHVCTITCSSPQ
jgi:hypothetical protein